MARVTGMASSWSEKKELAAGHEGAVNFQSCDARHDDFIFSQYLFAAGSGSKYSTPLLPSLL
jgi:hypothetical protein